MIEVKKVSKFYSSLKALDEISFNVEKGEILGLLGPNGAGKTTTMRIITGYLPASLGTVRVCGYDIFDNPIQVKKLIGYLPENLPLYPDMKTNLYLEYVARLKSVPKDKLKYSVDRVIDICGLEKVKNRLINNLSKGYKQRVGLAQAMVHDPKILILDEPTSGLDPKQNIEIRNLIKSLAGEHTIILSTHILPEVTMTCGRVAIINKGKVVAIDHHANLAKHFNNYDTVNVQVSSVDDKLEKIITNIKGVHSFSKNSENGFSISLDQDLNTRSKVAKAVVENNYSLFEFSLSNYSLEDVFLNLTTEEKLEGTINE